MEIITSLSLQRRAGAFRRGVFVGALLLTFSAHAADEAALQAALLEREKQALQAVCGTQCHTLETVMSTPMSYEAWHETVQTMIDRGANGTDEQLQDIMDYLHQTMTRIDVNAADAGELEIVLGISPAQSAAVVARREQRKFKDLADLKSVAGLSSASLDAKARLLAFQ
jgi:DNA uptake protein ComE-like DNA-binding protein